MIHQFNFTKYFCLLILLSLMTIGSGCAPGQKAKDTPLEIDHYWDMSFVSSYFNENKTPVIKELEKRTGVELKLTSSSSDDSQQIMLKISSGELPMMLTTWRAGAVTTNLIDSGKVWPMSDLIEKYAPEIYKNMPEEHFKYHKWSDGKVYF